MVKNAWALIVCTVLEIKYNQRVPVLCVSIVMLMEVVVVFEGDETFHPGLDGAQASMNLNNLKKIMVCNP